MFFELFLEYILFFAKTITITLSILAVVLVILGASAKQKMELKKGKLEVTNLSEKLKDAQDSIKENIFSKKHIKELLKKEKADKKSKKNKQKNSDDDRPKLFVLEFDGDIKASAVGSLQNCLNAILPVAQKNRDEILLKLESGGGMVHSYGLAAAQLDRIKQHSIKLNIAIDKVAASGGYMMACVADEIIAAPFAIIGSIGVLGQLPNFHKLLEKHNIEFEQHTAGEFKRTLTMFGKNDAKARAKFQEELEETHDLFKDYIAERRSKVDINEVATGEHWYGQQALELNLVDRLATSDDIVLEYYRTHDLFEVKYQHKKSLTEKLSQAASLMVSKLISMYAKPVQ